MRFFKHETHFDFIGTRKYAYMLSATLIIIGMVVLAVRGPKYGIDFTGGLSMQLDLSSKIPLQALYDNMLQSGVDSTKAAHVVAAIYKQEQSDVVAAAPKADTTKAVPAAVETAKADSIAIATMSVNDIKHRYPDLPTKYASEEKVITQLKAAGITDPSSLVKQSIANSKPITAQMLRDAMKSGGISDAEIQSIQIPEGDGTYTTGYTVRIAKQEGMKNKVIEIIQKNFPQTITDNQRDYIISSDDIGAKVGKDLRTKAVLAIIYSCIGIVIYIWFRFQFVFGLGAVLSLAHDVLTTLSMFALLQLEIDLTVVAAFLTLIGYSINDTIVVFDRIRENLRIYRKKSLPEIFNSAINETLSRTIITSLTVFMVVLCLYFFGGRVIHNFAFAMLFGVVTGTYSSIYMAAPFVIDCYLYRDRRNERKKQELKNIKGKKTNA